MATEMTPQERAAAVKHVVYMFGVPEFEVEGGEYENALAATVTLQRDTRRAALMEARQVAITYGGRARDEDLSGSYTSELIVQALDRLAQEG